MLASSQHRLILVAQSLLLLAIPSFLPAAEVTVHGPAVARPESARDSRLSLRESSATFAERKATMTTGEPLPAETPAASKPDPILADLKILPEIKWTSEANCAGRQEPPALTVSFEFQGKAALLASQIGAVHVDSFVDGNGKSHKWQCRPYASLRDFGRRKVQVSLVIPNRPAIKSIREVRGSVMLETGVEPEKMVLRNAFVNLDEPIVDKRLEALGVRIIPTRPLEPFLALQSQDQDSITIQTQWSKNAAVKGRACNVSDCKLFDAAGKRNSVGGHRRSCGRVVTRLQLPFEDEGSAGRASATDDSQGRARHSRPVRAP